MFKKLKETHEKRVAEGGLTKEKVREEFAIYLQENKETIVNIVNNTDNKVFRFIVQLGKSTNSIDNSGTVLVLETNVLWVEHGLGWDDMTEALKVIFPEQEGTLTCFHGHARILFTFKVRIN